MKDVALVFGVIAIIILGIRILISIINPSNKLHKNIAALGNMTGMTVQRISASVGTYNEIRNNSDGTFACTWSSQSYSITLLFSKEEKCLTKLHERVS